MFGATLAALALVLAWTPAPPDDADEPPPPASALAARLEQSWRWRHVRRGPDACSFAGVRALPDGRLLLVDAEGLWLYDGRTFHHPPGGEDLTRDRARLLDVLPEGAVLVSPDRVVLLRFGAAAGETSTVVDFSFPEYYDFSRRGDPFFVDGGSLLLPRGDEGLAVSGAGVQRLPGPPGERLYGIARDADGVLWAATARALWRHGEEGWAPQHVPPGAFGAGSVGQIVALGEQLVFLPQQFGEDSRGVLWDGARLTTLPALDGGGVLSGALAGPAGELIVALYGASLRILSHGRWSTARVPSPFSEAPISLDLLPDGRLVLVTQGGRLLACDLASERWRVHDPSPLVSGIVNALAESAAGGLWVGTHRGVARFDGGRFTDVHVETGGGPDLTAVTTLLEVDGELWVGSGSDFGGALRLAGGVWHHHTEPEGTNGLPVHGIRRAPDGALWFLLLLNDPGNWGHGAIARLHEGRWTRWDRLDDGPLPRAYDVAFDEDGEPLFGLQTGLARLQGERLVRVHDGPSVALERVFALHLDAGGRRWLGTGLKSTAPSAPDARQPCCLRNDGPRWRVLPAAAFAEAGGHVWATSEAGLRMVAPDLDLCLPVNPRAALESTSFWPVLASGGTLYLGSRGGGLVQYTPEDREAPETEILDLANAGDPPGRPPLLVVRGADAWDDTPPGELLFQVRVDGGPWSDWMAHARSTRPLSGLPPGEHVIEVRCADAAGNVDPTPAAWTLVVAAPLWRRPPMIVASGLALVGLLAALVLALRGRARSRRDSARLAVLNRQLHDLADELMVQQEDERRALSRDLHDGIGQVLTAAALHVECAAHTDDGERRDHALDGALTQLRQAVAISRDIAGALRPPVLDDLGLATAVEQLLADVRRAAPALDVVADVDGRLDGLEEPAQSHVYRILSECLTNVQRHAGARSVEIVLAVRGDRLHLSVTDDGVGFDPEEASARGRLGLVGMRERVQTLDGVIDVLSAPGQGARIVATIPLPRRPAGGGEKERRGERPWRRSASS